MAQGRQRVAALPATPPVYGLLIAADVQEPAEDGGDPRWQAGVEWNPEAGDGGVATVTCHGNTAALDVNSNAADQTADPFDVYSSDSCSTFGFDGRDYEGRARRALAAVQSFKIAREFQLGALRDADSLGNVALKDAMPVTPSPASVANAIAELEGAFGEVWFGQRGMLHVTLQTFALMKSLNLVVQAGQKWQTAQGTIVAADAGYTVEDDGNVWAYISRLPQIALGALLITPGSFPEAQAQALDRRTNTMTIFAQRLVLVRVDSTRSAGVVDALLKVQINVEPYAIDFPA